MKSFEPNITTALINPFYLNMLNKEHIKSRHNITKTLYNSVALYYENIYNNDITKDNYFYLNTILSNTFDNKSITLSINYNTIVSLGEQTFNINEYENYTELEKNIRITKSGLEEACKLAELLIYVCLLHNNQTIIDIKHEPFGINTHPDWLVIVDDNGKQRKMYIEIKSVYTTLKYNEQDNFYFSLTYNNATNCKEKVKKDLNKFHDSNFNTLSQEDNLLYDTLTIFFYYYVDIFNEKVVIYDYDLTPLALSLDFIVNDDGTIGDIRIKSNGELCVNTSCQLSLGITQTLYKFNDYFFFDKLLLYLTGKTYKGLDHILINSEVYIDRFNDAYNELTNYINNENYNIEEFKQIYNKFKELRHILKNKKLYNEFDNFDDLENINEKSKLFIKYDQYVNEINNAYNILSNKDLSNKDEFINAYIQILKLKSKKEYYNQLNNKEDIDMLYNEYKKIIRKLK